MRNLIIIFLGLILLKVVSLTLLAIDAKERKVYAEFYKAEIYRKYQEHIFDFSVLKSLTKDSPLIPKELKGLMYQNDSVSVDDVFKRKWYQDYFNELNAKFSSANLSPLPSVEDFPELMKNTVLEEHAKNEINSLYDKNEWFKWEYVAGELKGIIRNIKTQKDSLSIDMISFWYNTHELFDECVRGLETIPIISNPFYYKGPLEMWMCKILNPVTNEVQEIRFD